MTSAPSLQNLVACALAFQRGSVAPNLTTLAEWIQQESDAAYRQGAHVIVWPEYVWSTNSSGWGSPEFPVEETDFVRDVVPFLSSLQRPNLIVVAGSIALRDSTGAVRNQAMIVTESNILFQAKITLAPREKAISPGAQILPLELGSWKIAVLLCMDVELPEISSFLRQSRQTDLLLVPALADDSFGCQRLSTGLQMRSIELGCYGLLCRAPLSPDDSNFVTFSHPSQQAFRSLPSNPPSPNLKSPILHSTTTFPHNLLTLSRRNWKEPNPAKSLPPQSLGFRG